ncbi:MAG: hypothetical protein CMM60_04265 [Rhodospirillaceae bacterium]|nr:hypothetical protein [Rhodospirillaceae bacterium]
MVIPHPEEPASGRRLEGLLEKIHFFSNLLARKLRQKRQDSDDPRLNEIIDEIELRAEVEVAKPTRDPKGVF